MAHIANAPFWLGRRSLASPATAVEQDEARRLEVMHAETINARNFISLLLQRLDAVAGRKVSGEPKCLQRGQSPSPVPSLLAASSNTASPAASPVFTASTTSGETSSTPSPASLEPKEEQELPRQSTMCEPNVIGERLSPWPSAQKRKLEEMDDTHDEEDCYAGWLLQKRRVLEKSLSPSIGLWEKYMKGAQILNAGQRPRKRMRRATEEKRTLPFVEQDKGDAVCNSPRSPLRNGGSISARTRTQAVYSNPPDSWERARETGRLRSKLKITALARLSTDGRGDG